MDDTNVSTGASESTSTSVETTSAPAADSRPTTPDAALDAAFAELSKPAEPATTDPTAQAGEVPTTAEPPQEQAQPETEGKKGPIPFQVHETALKNAREKVAQETEQRLMAQLQQELQPLREQILFAQSLQANPAAALAQWLETQRENPEITALLARQLAGRRGLKPHVDEQEPQADLQTAEGELVYSAKQLKAWQDWQKRQLLGEVEQKFAPIVQEHEQTQKTREAAEKFQQYKATVEARAQERSTEWNAMPFMEKDSPHRAAILKRQGEIAQELHGQVNPMELPWVALQRAYAEYTTRTAIPSLRAKEQQQFIQTAASKTRGSQSDPSASAPAQPRKGRTPDEALDNYFASVAGA